MIPKGPLATGAARFLRVLFQRKKRQVQVNGGRCGAFSRDENGAESVEMALSISVLLTLIFGLIQICLAFYSHAYISELAREGSRYAALHGANCVDSTSGASCTATALQVQTYITTIGLPNLGGGGVSVDTNTSHMFPDGDQVSPHRVQVIVTYTFPYKIPFASSSTLSMSSTSMMTIIQ
jgi:Flp pilus assembly protein TadG